MYNYIIGISSGIVLAFVGHRVFRAIRPQQIGLDKMAYLTDRAAEAVCKRLRIDYKRTADRQDDFNNMLAQAVCDELFGRVVDSKFDQDFLRENRSLVDQKLALVKEEPDICKIVSQAAHIMGMVKYASSASGRPDEQYRSFEYKSVSLHRLNELGIDTDRYMPRGKSLFRHYKAFKSMVRKFGYTH